MKNIMKYFFKINTVFLAICFLIALLGNDVSSDETVFKQKSEREYPLAGIDNVEVDEEYVYCYSQYFQAVNVYDKNGAFQYSITVPGSTNGKGYMYRWNGYLCIKSNLSGDVYQYKNGEFVYRVIYEEDEEQVKVLDADDQIIKTDVVTEEIVGYFDDKVFVADSSADEILVSNSVVEDENGDTYSIGLLRPRLIKNNETIVKGSMVKILCSSPILTFVYIVLNEMLSRLLVRKG